MSSTFDEMIDLARRLGIAVRHVRLGGAGGGLVQLKGQRQLFIDQEAHPMDQLEQTARALAQLPELNDVFIRPDVRQAIERFGASPQR